MRIDCLPVVRYKETFDEKDCRPENDQIGESLDFEAPEDGETLEEQATAEKIEEVYEKMHEEQSESRGKRWWAKKKIKMSEEGVVSSFKALESEKKFCWYFPQDQTDLTRPFKCHRCVRHFQFEWGKFLPPLVPCPTTERIDVVPFF